MHKGEWCTRENGTQGGTVHGVHGACGDGALKVRSAVFQEVEGGRAVEMSGCGEV